MRPTAITVTDYASERRQITFDVTSGVVLSTRSFCRDRVPLGYGSRIRHTLRSTIAALYDGDDGSVLQIGPERWPFNDPRLTLDASPAGGPLYRFSVFWEGKAAYTRRYWSSVARAFGAYDPKRDSDEGDFFLYVWELSARASRAAPAFR